MHSRTGLAYNGDENRPSDESEKALQFKEIQTNDYLTKSSLPYTDYVINPYGGCTHACKYCYASFMKQFTGHTEQWGSFLDIKRCDKPITAKKLTGKTVFLSSVTDPYNAAEKKYGITRGILEQLKDIDCCVKISTKSILILRDLELLKQFRHLTVDLSINTLDKSSERTWKENPVFRKDFIR